MKIRMLGNSIRLRLSQNDMETLAAEGKVMERVDFGSAALQYGIEIIDGDVIQASLADHVLLVKIARTDAQSWLETEQVGISHTITTDGAPEMSILLEKDFACLVPRPNEGNLYPNPQAGKSVK